MSKVAIIHIMPEMIFRVLNLDADVRVLSIHQAYPRLVGDLPVIEMHIECEELPDIEGGRPLPVYQLVVMSQQGQILSSRLEVQP